MDINKPISELIGIESADFASQVYDVMEDGNDFCKSTMVVVIDEILHDLLAVVDSEDQADMLSIVHKASETLKDVMIDEAGEPEKRLEVNGRWIPRV